MRLKFMHDSSTSERITAIVSTLFAIGILSVAVTAQRTANAPVGDLAKLEAELMTQLDIAYRHDTRLLDKRVAQFNAVLRDWQAAPESAERDEKLAQWIREAMGRAMPGSKRPLPATPDFATANPQAAVRVAGAAQLPMADIIVSEKLRVQPKPSVTVAQVPDLAVPPVEEDFSEEGVDVEYVAAREWTPPVEDASFPESAFVEQEASPLARSEEPARKSFAQSTPVQMKTPAVEINLRELSARITGYHEGVRETEASLINKAAGDASSLLAVVETLEQLEGQRQLVSLYYDLLTEGQRRFLRQPRSLDTLVARVQTQLDNAERNHDGDFLKPFDRAAQRRLEQLRQRLNLLASE